MKAIRVHQFGGPEVMQLDDMPDPVPASGQALIEVKAIGVNPADTYGRAGNYGARNPQLPYTPGVDAAGIVRSVGEGVTDIKPGDRVYCCGTVTGAYAEYALCQGAQVRLLSPKLTFEQGAALHVPYFTAYRALFKKGNAASGQNLLIHGASGSVGLAAIQWARAAGLIVIGTAGTDRGLELIKSQGVHLALNHTDSKYRDQIAPFTAGRGVNLIVEMLANVNLGHDLKLLADRGCVVVVGSRGDVLLTPRDLMSREASIVAMTLWLTPTTELGEIAAAIAEGIESGVINPIISQVLPLAAAPEAHRLVMAPGANGKIILAP